MSETIRQCWAYNKDGQRCEHPAGHPGNHHISDQWTDDECYSPIKPQLPPTTPPAPKALNKQPLQCIACSHSHKGAECKCGCYEFIG